MGVGFLEVYIITFLAVLAIYLFLAGWTTIFYRKKAWGQLTQNELKVKQGTATIENRIDLCAKSAVTGLLTWQLHMITLGLTVGFLAGRSFLPG
jgi:spore coat protein CotH